MVKRTPWVERRFAFDAPVGWLYNILERLRGTSARLTSIVDGLPESTLTLKPSGKWSIKEHIGHLYTIEPMHMHRINQLAQKLPVLTAADMSNKKTTVADFNSMDVHQIIRDFDHVRKDFIQSILDLDDDIHNHSALHERMGSQMRPIDIAFFTGEHDDHHLADIRNILN